MKRYYISHPFTGNEEKNKADADRIRAALKEAHPDICFMNPLGMFGNKDTDYCTALADALELLSSCEAVIFCPGWEDSTGCRAEKAFALQQGIRIMYLEDFPVAMPNPLMDVGHYSHGVRCETIKRGVLVSFGEDMRGETIHGNRHDG